MAGSRILWIARLIGVGLVAWGLASYATRAHALGESLEQTVLGVLKLVAVFAIFLALVWGVGALTRRSGAGR